MKVVTLNPHGYCSGVAKAISLIEETKENYADKKIYLLGLPLHNEEVVSSLSSSNCILIDEKKIDLEEALNNITRDDIVIFSAHGHPEKYDEIVKRKNIKSIDCTCRFVNENLEYARQIKDDVIYIGKSNHIEATSFLANFDCSFFDVNTSSFLKEKDLISPVVICQTTLTLDEVYNSFEAIKKRYPEAKLGQERCVATKARQQSILDLSKDIDVVIILGSKLSSNSNALASLASSRGFETHLCLNVDEVKLLNLDKNKKVALTSGASTSKATFDSTLAYLMAL